VAMRLISSRSWRWTFSSRIQHSTVFAFRSRVARHFCLQNFSRPSTKYMFFVGDVAVHLRLGLAIINRKGTKRKLGFSKTLDFFCFEDDQNWEMQKKNQKKNWKYSQTQTRLNLDYLFPATAPEKGASWRYIFVLNFK
jgi:hypothetical protein